MAKKEISIFWFRRDLRLDDNVGFLKALKGDYPVLPIFIFDEEILSKLSKDDARVTFIYETLQTMRNQLQKEHGSSLAMYYGKPLTIIEELTIEYTVKSIVTNSDYEPYAKERDARVASFLMEHDIPFHTFKDQVIFEKSEIVKDDGDPYVVYTPYKNKWKERFNVDKDLTIHYTGQYLTNLIEHARLPNLSLSDIGFEKSGIEIPEYDVTPTLINNYEDTRNFPAKENGTSHLGPHLRFGTVSIRKMMKKAIAEKNSVFWNKFHFLDTHRQVLMF